MAELVSVQLTDAEAAMLTAHMNKLRTVWMLAGARKLQARERRILMEAIEAVESVLDPPVDYEGQ